MVSERGGALHPVAHARRPHVHVCAGKINMGDNVAFHLDMDAGTLEIQIRDGDWKEIFTDLHEKAGGEELYPAIFFYSSGGRKVTLHEVRQQGGKAPAKGVPVVGDKAKAGKDKPAKEDKKKDGAGAAAAPAAEEAKKEEEDDAVEAPGWARKAAASRLLAGGLHDIKPAGGDDSEAAATATATQLAFLRDLSEATIPAHLLDPLAAEAAAAASAGAGSSGAAVRAPDAADVEAEELAALLPGMRLALWLHRMDHSERSVAAAAYAAFREAHPALVAAAADAKGDSKPSAAGGSAGGKDGKGAKPKPKTAEEKAAEAAAKAAAAEAATAEQLLAPWTASQATSIRSAFAAYLWHAGLVQDAMACASFLRFQPNLGIRVASSPSTKSTIVAAATAAGEIPAPSAVTVVSTARSKALAATNGALPPALRAITQIFRGLASSLAAPLQQEAAGVSVGGGEGGEDGAAGDSAPAAGGAGKAADGGDLKSKCEALRKAMAETSFRVRGGAEDAKSPSPGATIPKHIQKELDKLVSGRAGLPLHITDDMGWETKKAKHM